MNSKIPAIVFFLLGTTFVVFSKWIAIGIRWLDKTIWNEEARRRFPGHGGKINPTPGGVAFLGASWIVCAVVFWFISRS